MEQHAGILSHSLRCARNAVTSATWLGRPSTIQPSLTLKVAMQCDPRASKRLVLLDAREKASDRAEFCSFVPNAHAAQTFDVLFHVEVILKHTFLDPAAWAALGC